MNRQDFYFELPQELIAQFPLPQRSDSRLLVYNRQTKQRMHQQFISIIEHLAAGDLLVFNNSKVIPARMYGVKESGGKVELLIERFLGSNQFLAHIKASKAPKPGSRILLDKNWQIEVIDKLDDLYQCQVQQHIWAMLEEIGHIPLPLYISRPNEALDRERYQTVYAQHKGSVAAPTAGLHFDERVFQKLKEKRVELAYLTLHVGAGTFRPLRCDALKDHKMHQEQFIVSESLCQAVNRAKALGRRVIAVGTTSLRSLEAAAVNGILEPYQGNTDIFIYPGYQFQICDGLITNFHLPESTLIMLVAAFIGHQETMCLYEEAIAQEYRFFSYGDACLLL